METKTTHHVVDFRQVLRDDTDDWKYSPQQEFHFSIDFEPVTVYLSAALHDKLKGGWSGTMGVNYWQDLVSLVCDTLGKERRDVWSHKGISPPIREGKIGSTVKEYIAAGSGWHWYYYMYTKIHHVNKFYHRYEVMMQESYFFYEHFETVYRWLQSQGIMKGKSYYEPSNATIDNFLKQLT